MTSNTWAAVSSGHSRWELQGVTRQFSWAPGLQPPAVTALRRAACAAGSGMKDVAYLFTSGVQVRHRRQC